MLWGIQNMHGMLFPLQTPRSLFGAWQLCQGAAEALEGSLALATAQHREEDLPGENTTTRL